MLKTIPYKHQQQVMHLGVVLHKKQPLLFIQILIGMLDGDILIMVMATLTMVMAILIMDGDILVMDGDTQATVGDILVMVMDTLTQLLMPIIIAEEVLRMEEITMVIEPLLIHQETIP
jgi:hypothetical protein